MISRVLYQLRYKALFLCLRYAYASARLKLFSGPPVFYTLVCYFLNRAAARTFGKALLRLQATNLREGRKVAATTLFFLGAPPFPPSFFHPSPPQKCHFKLSHESRLICWSDRVIKKNTGPPQGGLTYASYRAREVSDFLGMKSSEDRTTLLGLYLRDDPVGRSRGCGRRFLSAGGAA